ncbi:MAG: LysE family translocator [Boseongicola sp.]
MFSSVQLLAFIAASLVVLLTPGPGVAYVVARSISQGATAAFASAFGLSLGVLVHVAAAVVGLSAIIAGSALLFTAIKLIGAGYLIYLGISILRAGIAPIHIGAVSRHSWARLVRDGAIVSATNPKIAIFFLAFLPQFISANSASATSQIIVLGMIYAALALMTDTAYGVFAGAIRNLVINNRSANLWIGRTSGGLLIALGVNTALARAT